MKVKIILLVILFFGVISAMAQKNDLLFLKNGSVLAGKVLPYKQDSAVKIMIKGGSIFSFSYNEVLRTDINANKSGLIQEQTNGIKFMLNLGLLAGNRNINFYSPLTLDFDVAVGYKFNKHDIFLSSGLEGYDGVFIPVLAEYHYNFLNRVEAPYLFALGGYNFPLGTYYSSARMNPGVGLGGGLGVKRYFLNSLFFNVSLGYRFQHWSSEYDLWPDGMIVTSYSAHRYQFKIGLGF